MRKRDDFEDDGRTIADMSGIGPVPTLRPHRRKADAPPPEPANDRPWEQAPDWTPKEKFWAVMGVLKANPGHCRGVSGGFRCAAGRAVPAVEMNTK